MNNYFVTGFQFFRNTLVLVTSFTIVSVMTLPGLASATTPSQTAVTSITVGSEHNGVAVSPDGSSVWVTNYGGTTVSRIIFPPQSPSNVTATPGDANATISWSAPTTTGGSPITGYSATASPGGKSCTTTTATSCTITGLTNGTTYSVSVTASNAVGTSDPSVVAVTPAVPAVTAATAKLAATGTNLTLPLGFATAFLGLGGLGVLGSQRRRRRS